MNRSVENKSFYHVNSAGENVVFRDEDDCIQIMNDIPLAGFSTNTIILAFNVLSTHFHLCAISDNIEEFIKTLKLSFTRYFYHKYGVKGSVISIEAWKKTDVVQKTNALSYVLKNSVHHEMSFSPFKYPYSSIGCYFKNQLSREERFLGEYRLSDLKRPSDFLGRERRSLLRHYNLPDTYLIQCRKLIVPESYIDIRMVEGFYRNNYKNFLVEINRNDNGNSEIQCFGKRFVTTESLMISSQRVSDMEICRLIDKYVYRFRHHSFREFLAGELSEICKHLRRMGASEPQIKRCLWL